MFISAKRIHYIFQLVVYPWWDYKLDLSTELKLEVAIDLATPDFNPKTTKRDRMSGADIFSFWKFINLEFDVCASALYDLNANACGDLSLICWIATYPRYIESFAEFVY